MFTQGTTNRTAIARFFNGVSDGDGLPDAWEQAYFGTLAHDGTEVLNGRTLQVAYLGGLNPLFAQNTVEGGVSYADSGLVAVNLAGYPHYSFTSNPAGLVNQVGVAAAGTVVTTPEQAGSTNFAYWTLDGVRIRPDTLRARCRAVVGTDIVLLHEGDGPTHALLPELLGEWGSRGIRASSLAEALEPEAGRT